MERSHNVSRSHSDQPTSVPSSRTSVPLPRGIRNLEHWATSDLNSLHTYGNLALANASPLVHIKAPVASSTMDDVRYWAQSSTLLDTHIKRMTDWNGMSLRGDGTMIGTRQDTSRKLMVPQLAKEQPGMDCEIARTDRGLSDRSRHVDPGNMAEKAQVDALEAETTANEPSTQQRTSPISEAENTVNEIPALERTSLDSSEVKNAAPASSTPQRTLPTSSLKPDHTPADRPWNADGPAEAPIGYSNHQQPNMTDWYARLGYVQAEANARVAELEAGRKRLEASYQQIQATLARNQETVRSIAGKHFPSVPGARAPGHSSSSSLDQGGKSSRILETGENDGGCGSDGEYEGEDEDDDDDDDDDDTDADADSIRETTSTRSLPEPSPSVWPPPNTPLVLRLRNPAQLDAHVARGTEPQPDLVQTALAPSACPPSTVDKATPTMSSSSNAAEAEVPVATSAVARYHQALDADAAEAADAAASATPALALARGDRIIEAEIQSTRAGVIGGGGGSLR